MESKLYRVTYLNYELSAKQPIKNKAKWTVSGQLYTSDQEGHLQTATRTLLRNFHPVERSSPDTVYHSIGKIFFRPTGTLVCEVKIAYASLCCDE